MTKRLDPETATRMATEIVVAYLGNRSVEPAELPKLVREVIAALDSADPDAPPELAEPPTSVRMAPAVPVEESVTPDFLICLENGKSFRSLKRHLKVQYDMSPEDYRRKWDLPADYPMVAPNYSKVRSKLAKAAGFVKAGTPASRRTRSPRGKA